MIAFSAYSLSVVAQDLDKKTTTYKNVNRNQLPAAVVTSMEEDFPEIAKNSFGILPVALYQEEWELWEETASNKEADMVYYTVDFQGSGTKGRAVYNAEGKLMKFYETHKDAPLPEKVTKAIATNFPGWQILGDKEIINFMEAGMATYYKVKVKKGE